MANDQTAIDVREIAWCSAVEPKLITSSRGDMEIIKRQVINGVAQLWHCLSEKNEMLVVTRIDPGPELVIVLGEGSGLFEFAPHFLNFAQRNNLKVRTHVQRRGLIKMWSKLGLNVDEYVLRSNPNG